MINLMLCMAMCLPIQETAQPQIQDGTLFQRIMDRISGSESKILGEMRAERINLLERWKEYREYTDQRFEEMEASINAAGSFLGFLNRVFNMIQNLFWVVVTLMVLAMITRWGELIVPIFHKK